MSDKRGVLRDANGAANVEAGSKKRKECEPAEGEATADASMLIAKPVPSRSTATLKAIKLSSLSTPQTSGVPSLRFDAASVARDAKPRTPVLHLADAAAAATALPLPPALDLQGHDAAAMAAFLKTTKRSGGGSSSSSSKTDPGTAETPAAEDDDDDSGAIEVAAGPVSEGATRKRRAGRRWTAHEDTVLKMLVERNGQRHWKKCAREFSELSGSERSDVQCLHRWNKCLRPGLVKGQWTSEEDEIIRSALAEHGTAVNVRWSLIAKRLPGRLGKQVRERWINHLDPTIVKAEWTAEEDEKLYQLHVRFGNRWKWMAELMPGRSENGVKNRWHSIKPTLLARKAQEAAAAAAQAAAVATSGHIATSSNSSSSDGGGGSGVKAAKTGAVVDSEAARKMEESARAAAAAAVSAAAAAVAAKKRAAKARFRRKQQQQQLVADAQKQVDGQQQGSATSLAALLSAGKTLDDASSSLGSPNSPVDLQQVALKAQELLQLSESYREMTRQVLLQQQRSQPKRNAAEAFNEHVQREIAAQIAKQLGQRLEQQQEQQQGMASPVLQDTVLFGDYLKFFAQSLSKDTALQMAVPPALNMQASPGPWAVPSAFATTPVAGAKPVSPHQLLAAAAEAVRGATASSSSNSASSSDLKTEE